MRSVIRWLLTLSTIGLIALVGAYLYITQFYMHQPGPLGEAKTLIIQPGSSVRGIGSQLTKANIITSPYALIIAARLDQSPQPLKSGEYEFAPGISLHEVLSKLQNHDVYYRQFTIPEGYSAKQVVATLQTLEGLSGEIPTIAEGSILPETYRYTHGESYANIVIHMRARRVQLWEALWPVRDASISLTQEQANILASIVQEEAGNNEEMPIIAGVFYNRLKKNMRLQTDPTVIYAITEGLPLGRPLSRADLIIDSPYNTYENKGLPPTPIANPGEAAIRATLNPAQTDALYFVADGNGGHAFGNTLEEHNKNVKAYRKWLKSLE